MIQYLRSDVVRNIHDRLIDTYGGLRGVRDENALESALARPQQITYYSEEQNVPKLGAALAWSLLRNHPFSDGTSASQ